MFDENSDPQTSDSGDSAYDAYREYLNQGGGESGDSPEGSDRDYDTVQEGDDRADVPDAFSFDESVGDIDTAVKVAEQVISLAMPALKIIEAAVKDNPQAAAALKTLRVTAQVAGEFTDYIGKKQGIDLDRVPVRVPSGGKRRSLNDDVLAALSRSDD